MDKKEAVEILKELPDRIVGVIMPSDKFYDYAGALNFAIKQLEETRWIPVSERLPENDGNYLVTFGNGFIDTAPYLTLTLGFGLFREVIDESNRCIGEDFDYWDVIAWKPLPKPYESEGEK